MARNAGFQPALEPPRWRRYGQFRTLPNSGYGPACGVSTLRDHSTRDLGGRAGRNARGRAAGSTRFRTSTPRSSPPRQSPDGESCKIKPCGTRGVLRLPARREMAAQHEEHEFNLGTKAGLDQHPNNDCSSTFRRFSPCRPGRVHPALPAGGISAPRGPPQRAIDSSSEARRLVLPEGSRP
jgi:hypothetical protein